MPDVNRAIQQKCDDYFAQENLIITMIFCCLHRHGNTPGPRGAWQGVQLNVFLANQNINCNCCHAQRHANPHVKKHFHYFKHKKIAKLRH